MRVAIGIVEQVYQSWKHVWIATSIIETECVTINGQVTDKNGSKPVAHRTIDILKSSSIWIQNIPSHGRFMALNPLNPCESHMTGACDGVLSLAGGVCSRLASPWWQEGGPLKHPRLLKQQKEGIWARNSHSFSRFNLGRTNCV